MSNRATGRNKLSLDALVLRDATESDANGISALRTAAAEDLTQRYGRGHWSSETTESGVLRALKESRILVALLSNTVVGSFRLATKKPWAIDREMLTPVKRPLYLLDMAVAPAHQRHGIGRILLDEATRIGRDWPANSICLDAYDAPAGAGGFYAKCGYREIGRKTYHGAPLVYYELLL